MSSTAFIPRESEVRQYLQDIEDVPLLSGQEEKDLAACMAGHHSRHPEERLQAREARERFITSNLRLVVSIARKFLNRGLPLPDLIEEGNLGLLRAVERFDPRKKCRFSTYATWWIRQAIRRAISNTSRTVRVPSYMIEEISHWRTVESELSQANFRKSDISDVCLEADPGNRKMDMLKRAIRASHLYHVVRLDAMGPMQGGPSEAAEAPSSDQALSSRMESDRLQSLLRLIDKREASVLRQRFGLSTGEPMTLGEIAKGLRITRERVRQIEKSALKKLQRSLAPELAEA